MLSFLVLSEGDTRNRWRDEQVCPDVGQGTMAPWARRLGREKRRGRERRKRREKRTEEERGRVGDGKGEEKESGREREEPAVYGGKG
ncbi:hypothetical protein TNCV_1075311 [Trichonephila clavipes]|uniref:Uncharacterized protein n=1 Tax=Trichonephila clavipes TaxID=2585209 RepID=A0A8X6T0Q8_TRICX|nr:hypothetical protein TNCV_1075311 [Trichonephila clavipes]